MYYIKNKIGDIMDKSLFIFNRKKILNNMLDNSVLLSFSLPKGEVKNDVNRNYFYLCGNFEFENIVMLVSYSLRIEHFFSYQPPRP